MPMSRGRAVLYGALGGGLLGLMASALVAGRYALGSAVAVPLSEGSTRAGVSFEVATGGLYLAVLVIGMLGGLAIAGIAYGIGHESEPTAARFPLRFLLPVAALVSGLVAYGVLRAGLGAFGDIQAGVATISVSALTLTAAVAGAVAGAVTSDITDRLARPRVLGLEGAAWPTSGGALMSEMGRAVATPVLALVIAASFAVPLSQLLVAAEGTLAVALFAIAAGGILGGAALLAYRPWERRRGDTAG